MVRVEAMEGGLLKGVLPITNPFSIPIPGDECFYAGKLVEIGSGFRIHLEERLTLQVELDSLAAKEGLYVVGWRAKPELLVAIVPSRDVVFDETRKLSVIVTVLEKRVVPVRFVEVKDAARMIT
jgi:hypothetical protein